MNPEPIDTGVATDPAGGLHRLEARQLGPEYRNGWVGACSCGWEPVAIFDITLPEAKGRWARHADAESRKRRDHGTL